MNPLRCLARAGRLMPIALLAVLPFLPHPAAADGAVAVGVPASVTQSGYAYGRTTNSPAAAVASEHALNNCRTAKDATQEAKDLCIVVMTFKNQCIALALDPKAGTPGAGWAVAPTKDAAEMQAMAQCIGTAGSDRRNFCTISDSACDGQ